MKVLLILLLSSLASAQTLTLQGGIGGSHGLGTQPGPVIEARLDSRWLYTRGRFSFEKKSYLNSGTIATADLLGRVTHHHSRSWAGTGLEVSHAQTKDYSKTAYRLLLGAGLGRQKWSAGVFGFPSEKGTQNRSYGLRADLSWFPSRWAFTLRPYLLRYHNGPEWERVRSGGGIEILAGLR